MEPFLGQIMPVGFNFNPRGWAMCNGQLLPIAQYTALFSLLGTTFGGDGRTTFALPDLRGRSIRHVGSGAGLNPTTWGQRGGSNNVVLTVANIPSHNHSVTAGKEGIGSGPTTTAAGSYMGNADDQNYRTAAGTSAMANMVGNTGAGQSFNVDSPYLGIYVNIALTGIFPSRS